MFEAKKHTFNGWKNFMLFKYDKALLHYLEASHIYSKNKKYDECAKCFEKTANIYKCLNNETFYRDHLIISSRYYESTNKNKSQKLFSLLKSENRDNPTYYFVFSLINDNIKDIDTDVNYISASNLLKKIGKILKDKNSKKYLIGALLLLLIGNVVDFVLDDYEVDEEDLKEWSGFSKEKLRDKLFSVFSEK